MRKIIGAVAFASSLFVCAQANATRITTLSGGPWAEWPSRPKTRLLTALPRQSAGLARKLHNSLRYFFLNTESWARQD